MVERNTQIDLVIPFYNDSDTYWRTILYEYMSKENSNDRQVIGEERYRDWENFRYWFRAVETNCKWVNKVFLVVADESQIPSWLDTSYSKLRVVLHKEYIPSELLPTFNIMTIEDYFCKIKDLSNNYVYCNDDYFFLNKTTADMFFINDIPVYKDTQTTLKKLDTSGEDGTFYQCLNNGMDLQLKLNGNKSHWYSLDHLPVSHKKDFENKIIDENYKEFINANNKSRFRHKNNFSNHVFLCLYKDTMTYHKSKINGCYVSVRKNTDFNDFDRYDMVCFNDTQLLSHNDFLDTKKRMLDYLEKKFPNKSKFEKEEKMVKLQAIRDFTLAEFDKIKITKRADKEQEGWVYDKDEFECNEEMSNYLTGGNDKKIVVAKILELIPETKKNENTISTTEDTIIKETKKNKRSKK